MPIEIKELHIHVVVNASPSGQPSTGHQGEAGGGGQSNDNEAIVAECVEQVMKILQNKMER
ncbi:MAG: DUF5908 family protein [Methylococcales bacterium]|nr:DUF5908 family protein [Methylococcales bacterium]MDD5633617.1 DUF5908 family protein [Methylococcales bacterium]